MLQIVFIPADAQPVTVSVAEGHTVMDAALDNGIAGIRAQCGGGCTCCTCHCYLPTAWRHAFPPPSADERDLLEFAWSPQPGSRLACQLRLTAAHDGLVIEVPEQQA